MNHLLDPIAGNSEPPDDEQLELYALNLLDDDERGAVEERLATDPAARERLRQLRGAVAMLAFDIEPMQASSGLKSRILDAARADLLRETDAQVARAESRAPVSLAVERERRRTGRSWHGWAAAAGLAVALVGSLLWNAHLRGDLNDRPATTAHSVTASGNAAGASGAVVVVGDQQQASTALLTLSNLPALEHGKVYQVWLIAGTPEPNVTFVPDKTGFAEVAVPGQIANYQKLAVTIEPTGGSATPTSEPIILSNLTVSGS